MSDLIAKCGMDCGTCPWGPYPRQSMTTEEFEQYKKRAKKILGYTPMKTPCPTCQTSDEEIPKGSKLPPRNCSVRQCVDRAGVKNCAYCSKFPCEAVRSIAGAWSRDFFEKKHGVRISEEDYRAFIKPFEGLKRLEKIRASLSPNEIVEPPIVPQLKTKVIDFPEHLPLSKNEIAAFKALHRVLANIKRSSLGLKDTDTFAQQQKLKNRISHFLRFIWIFGRFGNFQTEKNGACLVVDAKTYIDNRGNEKALATWPFVKDVVFNILSEFGVHCERVMLKGVKEKDLTTPGGYLRSKGWIMRMKFDGNAGGVTTLKALQTYARKLDDNYGRKAFRYFSNVDMRVLSET